MSEQALTEPLVEQAAFGWLRAFGWQIAHGPELAPAVPAAARRDYGEVRTKGAEKSIGRRFDG